VAPGLSGGRSTTGLRRGNRAGLETRLVLGIVLQVLADEHRDDRRHDDADQGRRHADHQDLGQVHCATPFSAKSPIIAAVAADTGLAVMACCEAIVATAMGRSGRMPLWWAVS
jgi:hypothetical protein